MQTAAVKRDSHWTSDQLTTQLKDIKKTLPLRVLSTADWEHWTRNGYVIVRQAVPAANVEPKLNVLPEPRPVIVCVSNRALVELSRSS